MYCSTDAILPSWTYLLVTTKLIGIAIKVIQGSDKDFLIWHYQEILSKFDYSKYNDKSIILKGCSYKPVPQEIYTIALSYIQPFARSIMYGEACSAVPIYKKIKK